MGGEIELRDLQHEIGQYGAVIGSMRRRQLCLGGLESVNSVSSGCQLGSGCAVRTHYGRGARHGGRATGFVRLQSGGSRRMVHPLLCGLQRAGGQIRTVEGVVCHCDVSRVGK